MGDTTCLMQPFSYAAGIPNQAKEGNPIHALGQSVSFGRFMSESLAWEKWSTFSHNKYVEEAEKFSRPGSVAEMKAFFEAHYKNLAARKAAAEALLEQENSSAAAEDEVPLQQQPENKDVAVQDKALTQDSDMSLTGTQVAVDREEVQKQTKVETISLINEDAGCIPHVEMEENGGCNNTNSQDLVEKCVKVESLSQVSIIVDNMEDVKEMDLSETKQMEKPLLKDFISRKDDPPSTIKKKPVVSSSKTSINGRTSNKVQFTPAKPTMSSSFRARKEAAVTPVSKYAIDSMDKKKPTPKSSHKTMNFTPVREINRLTSSIIRKIDNSRVGSNFRPSKDCSTPVSSTQSGFKYPLTTPQSEHRRSETPLHPSASGSKTVRSKWNFLPTDCSKFMSSHRNRSQSPSMSTPFSFRTEERASRRKERLEERFNESQIQKVQLQATLKKTETEIKKLRNSLCFKARPLPAFYKERAMKKDPIEKVPLTISQSPEQQTNSNSFTTSTSQLPQKSSIKNTGSKLVMEKNTQKPGSLASRLRKFSRENTPPNIQPSK